MHKGNVKSTLSIYVGKMYVGKKTKAVQFKIFPSRVRSRIKYLKLQQILEAVGLPLMMDGNEIR